MIDIEDLSCICHMALERASGIILGDRFRNVQTENKELLDIVTSTDRSAETIIIETIRNSFPDHSIMTEESNGHETSSPYLWIIDPLDGTVNFRSGLPFFNVSIGLQYEGRTLVGGVALPALKQTYFAISGKGAFLGSQKLSVSTCELSEAVVSVILTSHFAREITGKTMSIISELAPISRGVRIIVSEALELSYIGAGLLSGNICAKADAYGAAAGQLIVEEAGGVVTDFEGARFTNSSGSIVASNGKIHEALLNLIADASGSK